MEAERLEFIFNLDGDCRTQTAGFHDGQFVELNQVAERLAAEIGQPDLSTCRKTEFRKGRAEGCGTQVASALQLDYFCP